MQRETSSSIALRPPVALRPCPRRLLPLLCVRDIQHRRRRIQKCNVYAKSRQANRRRSGATSDIQRTQRRLGRLKGRKSCRLAKLSRSATCLRVFRGKRHTCPHRSGSVPRRLWEIPSCDRRSRPRSERVSWARYTLPMPLHPAPVLHIRVNIHGDRISQGPSSRQERGPSVRVIIFCTSHRSRCNDLGWVVCDSEAIQIGTRIGTDKPS